MADRSKIEWTDSTWNPIRADRANRIGWHCEHVSEGCRNCYAESFNRRLGTGLDFKPGNLNAIELFLDEHMLTQPLRWKRPRRIFVGSMTDLFADFVRDEWLDRIFAEMALLPQHTFQLLTKRPERMRRFIAENGRDAAIALDMQQLAGSSAGDDGLHWPLPNVWLGVSCEDQPTADARIPELLATPAAIRFLSCEPLLGPIDLSEVCNGWYFQNPLTGLRYHDAPEGAAAAHDYGCCIDWVISGGESGPHARPMHPDWPRYLRDQCAAAGVPFHFKQWGEYVPSTEIGFGGHERRPKVTMAPYEMIRVVKWRASRTLDGIEHNAFPNPRCPSREGGNPADARPRGEEAPP